MATAPAPSNANTSATINVVATLPSPGNYGQYLPSPGVWESCYISNSYDEDKHIYMMGVTSPYGTNFSFSAGAGSFSTFNLFNTAFVQLTTPTLLWTMQWSAIKQGDRPQIPDPTTLTDGNWILLSSHIEPEVVETLPDGFTYVYTIRGIYWFGHANPANAKMFFPKPPWLADSNPTGRAVTSDMFVPGLTDTPGAMGTSNDTELDKITGYQEFNKPLVGPPNS